MPIKLRKHVTPKAIKFKLIRYKESLKLSSGGTAKFQLDGDRAPPTKLHNSHDNIAQIES